ncbi:hypothetical protein BT67DRAFT_192777 [Trichocladium antarcticum]|uniref:Uncharacterized protein n=1 Tax=Trichocladium antarcticum TaxID=1450529 RepID=A0AAN6UQ92_9PEZI|nr:hypothetical protein BT67DRAFT_192777 [Trichocladium antarcticum]
MPDYSSSSPSTQENGFLGDRHTQHTTYRRLNRSATSTCLGSPRILNVVHSAPQAPTITPPPISVTEGPNRKPPRSTPTHTYRRRSTITIETTGTRQEKEKRLWLLSPVTPISFMATVLSVYILVPK